MTAAPSVRPPSFVSMLSWFRPGRVDPPSNAESTPRARCGLPRPDGNVSDGPAHVYRSGGSGSGPEGQVVVEARVAAGVAGREDRSLSPGFRQGGTERSLRQKVLRDLTDSRLLPDPRTSGGQPLSLIDPRVGPSSRTFRAARPARSQPTRRGDGLDSPRGH